MKDKAKKLIELSKALVSDSERFDDMLRLKKQHGLVRTLSLLEASHRALLVAIAGLIKIELEEEIDERL